MKVWTVRELENVVASTKPLIGARLQEIHTAENDLALGFYTQGSLLWLWIDLNATHPSLLPWTELPLRLKWQKSPLNLFLRAHFADRVLREVRCLADEGRVVHLLFGRPNEEEALQLEVRLFPHGRNVIARASGKQVAWQKPKELSESVSTEAPVLAGKIPLRSLEELREQWLQFRHVKGSKKDPRDAKARLKLDLERKEKALAKVEDELQRKKDLPWKAVGDWLKSNQSLDVPKEWEPFVDKRRKLSWNIEQSFAKAREVDGKAFGTEKRLETLRAEIERTQQLLEMPVSQLPVELERPAPRPLKEIGAIGRTLRLSDELVVMAGKNASDNLKLLRKARAWDLWFHLRDYPSSHAILFRNKKTAIGEALYQQVAAWFVRLHLGQKYAQHAGERFHILIAECRFVRPIKGDKIGRVTYSDAKEIIFKVPR